MIELEPIDLKLRIDSWIWMLKLDVKMQHLMVHCDNALYVLNYKVRYPSQNSSGKMHSYVSISHGNEVAGGNVLSHVCLSVILSTEGSACNHYP